MRLIRPLADRRGSGLIESLLALPLLLLLISGGITVASIGWTYLDLLQAHKVTLQQVGISGYYDAAAQQRLAIALQQARIDPARVTVAATAVRQPHGSPVYLALTYNARVNWYGRELPLTVTLRTENATLSQYIPPP